MLNEGILSDTWKPQYFQSTNSKEIKFENNDIKSFSNSEEDINNISQSKKLFQTFLYHKRGKKSLIQKNKNFHSALAFDNIERKIKVHYMKFLVRFANDIVNSFLGYQNKCFFKEISYKIKREISYSSDKKIKAGTFADYLKKDICSRYYNVGKDFNLKNLIYLYENYPNLKQIFEQNYLEIFQKYYFNDEKPLKEIYIGNKKIEISHRTENYYYLKKKCAFYSNKLDIIMERVYFSEINYLQVGKFNIKKVEK